MMDSKIKKEILKEYERLGFKYDDSKDIYSNFACQLFNVPYEECLEFKNGEPYYLGQQRRQYIKYAFIFLYVE